MKGRKLLFIGLGVAICFGIIFVYTLSIKNNVKVYKKVLVVDKQIQNSPYDTDEEYRYTGFDQLGTKVINSFKDYCKKEAKEEKQYYNINLLTDTTLYKFGSSYDEATNSSKDCDFEIDTTLSKEDIKKLVENDDMNIDLDLTAKNGIWSQVDINDYNIPKDISK